MNKKIRQNLPIGNSNFIKERRRSSSFRANGKVVWINKMRKISPVRSRMRLSVFKNNKLKEESPSINSQKKNSIFNKKKSLESSQMVDSKGSNIEVTNKKKLARSMKKSKFVGKKALEE